MIAKIIVWIVMVSLAIWLGPYVYAVIDLIEW